MPRLARKYLESPYCHIIVQGINKEYIFKEIHLKDAYRNILKRNLCNDIKILAYCIMDNHAHILLYTKDTDKLTKLMHNTNTAYAKLYNKTKNRVGYVFRDRYYVQMILNENHLFNCIAYIHANPVKANIVEKFEEYTYSSYKEYIDKKILISLESIKLVFGNKANYISAFKEIHNNYTNIEDIIEVKEEIKESNQIISEYIVKKNKSIEEIKNNKNDFCDLLLELRHYGGLSLREMSILFNINKDKLNKIINRKL